MKKILVIATILLSMQVQAQFKSATLQASGLTCAMCSKAIYKSLEKLSFAKDIQSNIKESTFTIQFKENAAVDFDQIKTAVEGAGFSIANLRVTANFDGENVKNDSHMVLNGKTLHFVDVKQQVLSGEKTFNVVDKKFVSDKVYKKYASLTKMSCIKTGVMENCCSKEGVKQTSRIYHVTI